VWTVEAALTYARCMTNGVQSIRARVVLLPRLVPGVRPSVVGEALKVARGHWNAEVRARALAALAPHLDADMQRVVLGEALEAARGIPAPFRPRYPPLAYRPISDSRSSPGSVSRLTDR
jgi:hypothetical protein